MVKIVCLALLAFRGILSGAAPDLTSPLVFSAEFYININPEVILQNILTVEQARQHWITTGLRSGLQACGNFHTRQYLKRYPNLALQFGQNYTAAAEHYLTEGQKAGLLGYVDGGFEGRYTISDVTKQLFVSVSERMGGSVDSLVFNNTEFINSFAHGRELQVAMTFEPNGECFNPTEGGSRDDFHSPGSTTRILFISAERGKISTTILPAFWMQPGDKEINFSGDNCRSGSPALNTEKLYPFPLSKNISIGCPGVGPDDPCFTFRFTIIVGGKIPNYTLVRVEGPTGYHPGEFNTTKSLDAATGALVPFKDSQPLVISSWSLQHAFAVWAPPGQNRDYPPVYGYQHFVVGKSGKPVPFPSATQKWNVVWYLNTLPEQDLPKTLGYEVYICVGTQSKVAECMTKVIQNHGARN